jgi:hypothetical protein
MFRLAKVPSSGQLQSLNHVRNGVCAHYWIPYCLQDTKNTVKIIGGWPENFWMISL